ncbi:hypothetical protein GEMRC1_009411 [Eukaryota sp. GEM-RC1]
MIGLGLYGNYLIPTLVLPQIAFIFCAIEEHHTGTLFLGFINAPTEGLLMVTALNIAVYFGLHFPSQREQVYLILFVAAFAGFTLINSLVNIFIHHRKNLTGFFVGVLQLLTRSLSYLPICLYTYFRSPSSYDLALCLVFTTFLTSFQTLDVLVSVVSKNTSCL